jgi:hypothetical protein
VELFRHANIEIISQFILTRLLRKNMVGVAGLFVGLALALPAYAGYFGPKFANYPERKTNDCAVKAEKAGVVLGVLTVEDSKEQKTYFDALMIPRAGYMPVYVVLENRSSGDSFLFDKKSIEYGASSSAGLGTGALTKANNSILVKITEELCSPYDCPYNLPHPVLMDSSGMASALSAESYVLQIQQQLLKIELQSKTLSPGQSVHGFLYLPVPKKGPRDKIMLRVPMIRAGTGETFVLEVVF